MNLIKMLCECGNEFVADGGVMDNSIAYESAGSLLDDPKVLREAKKLWPNKSKDILQQIMADYI